MSETKEIWREKFEECTPYIEAALEFAHGTHTIKDIEAGIECGLFQLWPGKRSAIVTEIVVYPQRKECRFFLAGGDLDELQEMEPCVAAWAKQLGCTMLTVVGRRGWERSFLKDRGYESQWSILVKEI